VVAFAAIARPYVTLAKRPSDMVRLACTKCDRRGLYSKATLIERFGVDANMVELRLELAAGCPKIAANKITDLCGVYPDRVPYSPPSRSTNRKFLLSPGHAYRWRGKQDRARRPKEAARGCDAAA
jgi:hypothetical protein